MLKKKIHIPIIIFCLLLIIPSCFLGIFFHKVTRETSTRIQRGVIAQIIASESPVYYDGGQSPIGVFFERTHRKHVPYKDIPKEFIKAVVAAEDRNFFDHIGFDLKAAIRAFVANLKAGKVVQGGSTITQQTAKNIFKREKRSYKAKLVELIQAFLLERKYTKEEILEMYVNQFFVNGFGKGLGIAAQYFFDKDAKDIDLLEAAFIAGSFKGPNRYNPFIKKTEDESMEARRLAKSRKDYVLLNMWKMNFITKKQYLEAKEKEVPFKEGKITYRLNVILDYIREQLESDYFGSILQEQGIENPATSGIKIYTSINKDIQEAALRSLRTRLPVMDVKLTGYNTEYSDDIYAKLLERGLKKSAVTLPFLSRITHIDADNKKSLMVVSWDNGGGIIDYEGLKPMFEAWMKWKFGGRPVFEKKRLSLFLKGFQLGDLVPVQEIPISNGKGGKKLMLSNFPELEGGIVVLHRGMVTAMVGGFFDRFFNRAVHAKRQLGSIFKPIVYAAALKLKWNSLDPLVNITDIFQFENTFYIPRPDHTPKSESVSMVWAGAKSENLATVWLLYHLTDRLNMNEFRQVMQLVGLDRKEHESYQSYKRRIRDTFGVVVNRQALKEAAFEESKKEIESDIIFGGYEEILNNVRRLHFNIDGSRLDLEGPHQGHILRFDFKRICRLNVKMKDRLSVIIECLGQGESKKIIRSELPEYLRHFYRTADESRPFKIVYTEDDRLAASEGLLPLTLSRIKDNPDPLLKREVWIDGLITPEILDLLQEHTNRNYKELVKLKKYDSHVLAKIRDFKTLVNLSYVMYLSKGIGISTKLDPVLSFPLGPNSISISEAALAYQTIMTGQLYPIGPGADPAMVPLITKIVDREGEIVWEYNSKPINVLSERVSALVTEILRKVMENGTGHKAKDAVRLFDIPIPTFGKTGTANRFTNSSFVGFLPGTDENKGQLDLRQGYVIASYVGYDDNRPMKGKHQAIYGSSGALPLWVDTSQAIVNTVGYGGNLEPADLAFNPVLGPAHGHEEFQTVPISTVSGLCVRESSGQDDDPGLTQVLSEVEPYGTDRSLKRHFEPILGEME